MKPQWNAVFATSKTTLKRSLTSGDRPILIYFRFFFLLLETQTRNKSQRKRICVFNAVEFDNLTTVLCAAKHRISRKCDISSHYDCMHAFDSNINERNVDIETNHSIDNRKLNFTENYRKIEMKIENKNS